MIPCRMCGETPKTGKNQILGAVWMSSGPKESRPGAYHRDRAHGHGKEERPTFHAGKTNKISTKISRFKKEPADEPAGGEPGVCSKASTFCISNISGQDDQGSGEAPAKEVGSPNSGEFIVRKISLEHQQNWEVEFPSVDPKQDQQMHASRARSAKGIARLEEHQPEEGEQGRNEDLPGKKLVADLLSKIIAVKPSWERFWRVVNRQGSGIPNEAPTIGSNRRKAQPLGEEHHPEEPDQETSSWDNYRVIAGRCVSVVKKVVGLAKKNQS